MAAVQQGKVARKVVERKLSFGRRPPEHVKFVKVAQREVDGKPVGTLQYGTDAKGTGAKELQLSGIRRIEHARDRCELRVFSSERLKPLTIAFADAPTVDQWAIGLAKPLPGRDRRPAAERRRRRLRRRRQRAAAAAAGLRRADDDGARRRRRRAGQNGGEGGEARALV